MNYKIVVYSALGLAIGVAITLSWGRLGALGKHHQLPSLQLLQGKENIVPVAVIGSGPAGLSAALYSARFANTTIVFAGPKPGGLLTETSYVENWPGIKKALGTDIMRGLEEQAKEQKVQIANESVTAVDFSRWPFVLTTDEGITVHALTVIVATGAVPRKLGIPGEEEYWAKGVSSCAVCDALLFTQKNVVVIGGGDSAAEEALQLAKHAKSVTLLVRKDAMRASAAMQQQLAQVANIAIRYSVKPTAIVGNGSHVTGIRLAESSGEQLMPIDGVFLAIGHEPKTDIVREKIALDSDGYVVVQGRTQQTSVPGVFAAGDVEDHRYRQAGYAAGHGIAAAIDANDFLQDIGFNQHVAQEYSDNLYEPIVGKPSLVHSLQSVEEFKQELATTAVPLLLDCYAQYCSSCLHMMPAIESVAHKFANTIKIFKIDIEHAKELADHLQVRQVPTLLLYKQGKVVAQKNVAQTKKELIALIEQALAA
ncbi:FAD-dependent oxidoreductase [Candidatus Dependentiae bacterium]|nr:FAD-dependent oxidoreductase [Candidatus Dependentiae bacterium]